MKNIDIQELAMELADYTNHNQISEIFIRRIRESCGGDLILPLPIEELARIAGIENIEYKEGLPFEGMLVVDHSAIVINKSNNQRERFTIGHEIGHFLIPHHRLKKRSFRCEKKDTSSHNMASGSNVEKIEVEANRFASSILMPQKEFTKAIGGRDFCMSEIVRIAIMFDTSIQATCIKYAQVSGKKLLFIVTKGLFVEKILRSGGFPRLSISIQKGSPISPRAITVREANNKEKISEIEEIDETIWLEGRLTNNQKLWEQSYKQEGDYRITALYVEESESMDEDEIYAEEQSRWDVKFR